MRRLVAMSALAVLLGSPAAAVADEEDKGFRRDRGCMLEATKAADKGIGSAAEPAIIPRDVAIDRRAALKPLMERVDKRGMRTSEAEYVEELRLWAIRQHECLLELQKVHSAYKRLKGYRDRSAAKGEDTSRIDPRLEGMKKKLADLSAWVRHHREVLRALLEAKQQDMAMMSNLSRQVHETAMSVLRSPEKDAKDDI